MKATNFKRRLSVLLHFSVLGSKGCGGGGGGGGGNF